MKPLDTNQTGSNQMKTGAVTEVASVPIVDGARFRWTSRGGEFYLRHLHWEAVYPGRVGGEWTNDALRRALTNGEIEFVSAPELATPNNDTQATTQTSSSDSLLYEEALREIFSVTNDQSTGESSAFSGLTKSPPKFF
jgi:hypothetical protein